MPDSAELAPGALVTPSIRLERLLGRGGMGSVWLAEHLQLRAHVVVKFMTAERADNEESQQRFRREAELAAQAKSPHVVQIFDHGVSQLGTPYIVMELLEGEDLGKRIAREGAIEPRRFADWLAQACRGLARAHAKGIVHRDIKPENIFLCDNDGEVLVKVLDFGVAKGALDPSGFLSTQTGTMLGTAYYMSPEQTMGRKDIDHRSDLWALAVVTFYALTGVRPFAGDGIGPLVLSITTEPLPRLSQSNPSLSGELDAWMLKALARNREERFQSAKELAEAFGKAVGAEPQTSAPSDATTWPEPAPAAAKVTSESSALAASTMAPSVIRENLRSRATGSASRRYPAWAIPVAAGAVLGLAGVLGLGSRSAGPRAAASGATVATPATRALPAAPPAHAPALLEGAAALPIPSASVSAPLAAGQATARARPRGAPPSSKPAPAGSASAAPIEPVVEPRPPAKNPLDMKLE